MSDSALTGAEPVADIRSRRILDLAGEVRFLLAGSGGFLGLGETMFLIPVDAITRPTGDTVYSYQTRQRVAGGPHSDLALAEQPAWDSVYGY